MSAEQTQKPLVTTREAEPRPNQYVLLTPGYYPPRTGRYYGRILAPQDIPSVLDSLAQSPHVALDLETTGLDYHTGEVEIVGMGLAWNRGSCYIEWNLLDDQGRSTPALSLNMKQLILEALRAHPGLLAHNAYFDAGVLRVECEKIAANPAPSFSICTRALLALLGNEGWPGQTSSLKPAQTTLLGWEERGDAEMGEWLVAHGYYTGVRRVQTDEAYLRAEYRAGNLSPDGGQMWRVPRDILGKYCILDAESTYLLHTQVLLPVLKQFPDLEKYIREELMYLIDLSITQKIAGIEVDRAGLLARRAWLLTEMAQLEQEFLTHPTVAPAVDMYEEGKYLDFLATEPKRKKKNGEDSKNWLKWEAKRQVIYDHQDPEYLFNIQSGDQLRHLLYSCLGMEVRVLTDSGEPGTGIKALKGMGEIGGMLVEHSYLRKELGYIEDYIERTEHRSTIHPDFRIPGTMTGRLSSGKPNMQQIPKSRAVMSLFRARPGHVWIDLDFAALEPTVAAEFSGDENMMRIYGDGAPKNDIYLFVGAHIPGMGEKIRACGYDPYCPTAEGLARAKKECKRERGVCKTVVLACQYGAGVRKIHSTLEADGVFLSMEEVEAVWAGYWGLFAQVREYGYGLKREWRERGGYILNGMGRPMCVPEDASKDLLNRFIQSTGHDILVKYIRIYTEEMYRRGITYTPICIDWHDASCIEVQEEDREAAIEVFQWGLGELNRQLGGTIRLRGEPDVGYNLADVKRPEE